MSGSKRKRRCGGGGAILDRILSVSRCWFVDRHGIPAMPPRESLGRILVARSIALVILTVRSLEPSLLACITR